MRTCVSDDRPCEAHRCKRVTSGASTRVEIKSRNPSTRRAEGFQPSTIRQNRRDGCRAFAWDAQPRTTNTAILMTTRQDQFHGIPLARLIRRQAPVRPASGKRGHFCIGSEKYLLVKYRTHVYSPWRFTLRPNDIATLLRDQHRDGLFGGGFISLVCGPFTFCTLAPGEWGAVLDLERGDIQQSITVRRVGEGGLAVSGSGGRLSPTIPASRLHAPLFK
jgi:hypothetical protein